MIIIIQMYILLSIDYYIIITMICYINSNTLLTLSLNDGIFHTPSSEFNDILILKSVMVLVLGGGRMLDLSIFFRLIVLSPIVMATYNVRINLLR